MIRIILGIKINYHLGVLSLNRQKLCRRTNPKINQRPHSALRINQPSYTMPLYLYDNSLEVVAFLTRVKHVSGSGTVAAGSRACTSTSCYCVNVSLAAGRKVTCSRFRSDETGRNLLSKDTGRCLLLKKLHKVHTENRRIQASTLLEGQKIHKGTVTAFQSFYYFLCLSAQSQSDCL